MRDLEALCSRSPERARHEHEGAIDVFRDFLEVRLRAFDKILAELVASIGHERDGLLRLKMKQNGCRHSSRDNRLRPETHRHVIRHDLTAIIVSASPGWDDLPRMMEEPGSFSGIRARRIRRAARMT